MVDAVVVYGGLEEVGVGFKPVMIKLVMSICVYLGRGWFVLGVFVCS